MNRRSLGLTGIMVFGLAVAGTAHAAPFGTQASANAGGVVTNDGGAGSLSANTSATYVPSGPTDVSSASVTASGVVTAGQSTVLTSSSGLQDSQFGSLGPLPATGTATLNDTFTATAAGTASVSVTLTGLPDFANGSTNSYQLALTNGTNVLDIEHTFNGTTTTDQVFLNGVADAAASITSIDSTDATVTVPFAIAAGDTAIVSTLTGTTSTGGGTQDISALYALSGVPGSFASSATPSVPEPATFAVLGAALAGLAVARRRA